jgi:hypothetical protein
LCFPLLNTQNENNGISCERPQENPNYGDEVVIDDLALVDPEEAQQLMTFSESVLGETKQDLPSLQNPVEDPDLEQEEKPVFEFDETRAKLIATFSSDLGSPVSPHSDHSMTSPRNSVMALGTTRNLQLQTEKREVLKIGEEMRQHILKLLSSFTLLRQLKIDSGTLLNENSPEFYRNIKQSQETLNAMKPTIALLQEFRPNALEEVRDDLFNNNNSRLTKTKRVMY